MSQLIKPPPRALVAVRSVAEARLQLDLARARFAKKRDELEQTLRQMHWSNVVVKHPLITIGGAFLVGYALSRVFSKK